MNIFTMYDLILLGAFVIFASIFLYLRRKNLKRDGLLFIYRTKIGVKIINSIGKKYKKTLNFLSYVSIGLGFALMGGAVYFFGKVVWVYVSNQHIAKAIKLPPIMPLIPYIDRIVPNLSLPSFYFTYWIIILAIVAISHEFSHGIFAINKDVKIKSTGFGFFPFFLPVFLAAFVELDEKRMAKKKIKSQMAVLSAGTFANVIIGFIATAGLILFFSFTFVPSGVMFDSYSYSTIEISNIASINGIGIENGSYDQILNLTEESKMNQLTVEGKTYFFDKQFLEKQTGSKEKYMLAYDDAPAVRAGLGNIITRVNGVEVNSKGGLAYELSKYKSGNAINITTLENGLEKENEIVLDKNPADQEKPYLGIGFLERKSSGIFGSIIKKISSFRDVNIYYAPKFEAAEFIYNLLWWLVLISFSVAFMNMLPVGIFDGGRFFYLTILAITKKEKIAKKAFSLMTYLFLALLAVIMIFWGIGFFK